MKNETNGTARTLILDCSSGVSGDMVVAALLDLGADERGLRDMIASIKAEGAEVEIKKVIKSGLSACDFDVILDEEHENHDHDMAYLHPDRYMPEAAADTTAPAKPAFPEEMSGADTQSCGAGVHGHAHEVHGHDHDHADHGHDHDRADHGHDHTHHHGRNLAEITDILTASKLNPEALDLALKIFRIVAQAEAQVHGKDITEVHFHEVGAIDSIIDIASAAFCFENLKITECIVANLTDGTGTVRCQHGILPVPVPAVTQIMTQYNLPVHIAANVRGELITPTGAAIVAAVWNRRNLPEQFRIRKIGLGAGKRDYDSAGVVRALLVTETNAENHDEILTLQTNLDDCSGEALGYTMEKLLEEGALDVFYIPVYMKKHRPGYLLTVLCEEHKRSNMEEIIFRNTTTIGVRCSRADRTKLVRRIISVETPWGMADVKLCRFGDEELIYPESDSVMRLCESTGLGYLDMYNRIRQCAVSFCGSSR